MADLDKLHEIITKTSHVSYKADRARYIYETMKSGEKTGLQLAKELGLADAEIYKFKAIYARKLKEAEIVLQGEVKKN